MVPVPRKPGAALSATNVRGVSAGSHPEKVVAKAVRRRVAAIFPAEAGDDLNGSVASACTGFPMHACRLLLKMPRQGGMPAAALFADVKGAFYRVPQELAVGACMKRETRVEVAEQLSTTVDGGDYCACG